jgi:hypothetical protein
VVEEQAKQSNIHMRGESITQSPRCPGKKAFDIRPLWQVTIESVLRKSDSLACTFCNGLAAVQGIRITITTTKQVLHSTFETSLLGFLKLFDCGALLVIVTTCGSMAKHQRPLKAPLCSIFVFSFQLSAFPCSANEEKLNVEIVN